jgi:hypothetical protein
MLKNERYWEARWEACSRKEKTFDSLQDDSSVGDRLGTGDSARKILTLLAEYAGIITIDDDFKTSRFRQAIKLTIAPYFTKDHLYRSNSKYFDIKFIISQVKDTVGKALNKQDSLFHLLSVIIRHTGFTNHYKKIEDPQTVLARLEEGRELIEEPNHIFFVIDLEEPPVKVVRSTGAMILNSFRLRHEPASDQHHHCFDLFPKNKVSPI